MTDYQTYATAAEALDAIDDMHGWDDPHAVEIYLPDSDDADDDGNVWVVEARGGVYLRRDGYVR